MTGALYLIVAFLAGIGLGMFFSFNLWASVKRLTDDNTPWYVIYGSFMLRMIVVVSGFYLVTQGRWERMVAALLGFILVREVMVRRMGGRPGIS